MNRTAKGWLTDARSHINAAIEMLEKQTDLKQGYLVLSHISDAQLAVNKAASALPGVPDGIFPPDPGPEGLAQIAKLDAAEHIEWIEHQSVGLPNVHIGLLQGHKAVITNTGINKVWQVEIGTFFATFDSLERAKQSAEIVLRDRANRVSVMWPDRDQFGWVNPNITDPVPQLSADYEALKDAGNAMAAASFRVATEYDGCHRLMLAVSDWARAVANEGGRGNAS